MAPLINTDLADIRALWYDLQRTDWGKVFDQGRFRLDYRNIFVSGR